MTATATVFSRGLLSGSNTTLYTVPAGCTAVVTNVTLANTTGSTTTATVGLDGVTLVPAVSMPANTVTSFDLRQVLGAGKLITGQAGVGSAVACHISGAVIS